MSCVVPVTGGYAILKGIQKGMRLPAEKMMPSFANLKDFGNTSSSTTWYSYAYIETVGDVKRNHIIMQVGWPVGVFNAKQPEHAWLQDRTFLRTLLPPHSIARSVSMMH
jgi:hypothetical protein